MRPKKFHEIVKIRKFTETKKLHFETKKYIFRSFVTFPPCNRMLKVPLKVEICEGIVIRVAFFHADTSDTSVGEEMPSV